MSSLVSGFAPSVSGESVITTTPIGNVKATSPNLNRAMADHNLPQVKQGQPRFERNYPMSTFENCVDDGEYSCMSYNTNLFYKPPASAFGGRS